MALVLVKNFTVANNAYTNMISASNPLTIEQDGSIDDITLIAPTTFYIFNDGRRRDPVFDSADGTVMSLKYTGNPSITITPKPFTTTIKIGTPASTNNKLYLSEVSKTVPGGTGLLSINVGTVLTVTAGVNNEDVLVQNIGGDATGSFVNVVRNYKGSSSTGSILDLVGGSNVSSSVKHIFLTLNIGSFPSVGGNSVVINDINNEISNAIANPDPSLYQTIYAKAVPQLNKGVPTSDINYVGRIPTQYKTDIYFEVAYRELPR